MSKKEKKAELKNEKLEMKKQKKLEKKERKAERRANRVPVFPKAKKLSVLILLDLLVFAVFLSMLVVVNTFPLWLICSLLGVMLLFMILIVNLLNCEKQRTMKRDVGVFLSIVMMILMLLGSYYLFSTYSAFNKMSNSSLAQTEDFHVIVKADSPYAGENATLSDISGETVFVTSVSNDTYKEAQGKLMNEVSISLDKVEDYTEAGNTVLSNEKVESKVDVIPDEISDTGVEEEEVIVPKADEVTSGGSNLMGNIIFISNVNYEMLCEEVDNFKDDTKILKTISVKKESKDISKRVDVTKESFNIYISGIDTFGSINSVSRSDVNMIMTVNPKTKEILLTSIPRDTYIPLHTYQANDKLTHSGIYGVEETLLTVEDWLDLDLNYYMRLNFTSLVDIVDALGGIEVDSPFAFKSAVSENRYTVGINQLNGEEALYFARERKAFEDGDAERVRNQQRVLQGIIDKATSPAILTNYTRVLGAVEGKLDTNLDNSDISALVKMQIKDLGDWKITSNSVECTGSHASTYSMGSRQLYVAIPVEESVINAQNMINKVMFAE